MANINNWHVGTAPSSKLGEEMSLVGIHPQRDGAGSPIGIRLHFRNNAGAKTGYCREFRLYNDELEAIQRYLGMRTVGGINVSSSDSR